MGVHRYVNPLPDRSLGWSYAEVVLQWLAGLYSTRRIGTCVSEVVGDSLAWKVRCACLGLGRA